MHVAVYHNAVHAAIILYVQHHQTCNLKSSAWPGLFFFFFTIFHENPCYDKKDSQGRTKTQLHYTTLQKRVRVTFVPDIPNQLCAHFQSVFLMEKFLRHYNNDTLKVLSLMHRYSGTTPPDSRCTGASYWQVTVNLLSRPDDVLHSRVYSGKRRHPTYSKPHKHCKQPEPGMDFALFQTFTLYDKNKL